MAIETHPYYVAWSSVDGCGSDDRMRFATLEEARAEADRRQRVSDEFRPESAWRPTKLVRNPWGYRYWVVDVRRSVDWSTVYRSTPAPAETIDIPADELKGYRGH